MLKSASICSWREISVASGHDVNDVLAVLTGAVSYGLQSVVEQGVSLLGKLLESQARELSGVVRAFPDHLRFGVPTPAARALSAFGIRHRRAAILLGNAAEVQASVGDGRETLFQIIGVLLANSAEVWREQLGALMYGNTVLDVS